MAPVPARLESLLLHSLLLASCVSSFVPLYRHGMRGVLDVELFVSGSRLESHSGLDGGTAHEPMKVRLLFRFLRNPVEESPFTAHPASCSCPRRVKTAQDLVRLLGSLFGPSGEFSVPGFFDDVCTPDPSEVRSLGTCAAASTPQSRPASPV